ncbi:MAG: protein kinase, partial [bacterium]|nr:protein kinase [bacterium]
MTADDNREDRTRSFEALTAGTRIEHYQIITKVGSGGMGEVYLARDLELDRKVALKFLPLHLCPDEDCRRRFRREAQAAARLSHPNIVHVYEVSEYEGRPFFAMEHIEGLTLKEYLGQKKMGLEQILDLVLQICEGLQAAHEAEITHRDIKPTNIIIDSHGRARIVDFGLASVKGTDQLTKTGSTLGTVGYMSPEQVRGDEVDRRSDLFSLGVVLYELVTGHRPFAADSEAATLHAITQSEPEPIARYRRRASEGLQQILTKLLEKSTTTRYQHADGLRSDLIREKRRLDPETSQHLAAAEGKGGRRSLWVAITLLAVVCLIALWQPWQSLPSGGQPDKIMLAVLPFENLGDSSDGYFADGVTDEILTDLAQLSGLSVISRTSSMQYRGSEKNLRQIGKELDVDYVLEGTIRWEKSGETDRVRISPQLIRIDDDTHLWAERYDAVLTDIFEVQSGIARQVAEALDIALLKSEEDALDRLPTTSALAYDYYLRGKQLFTIAAYRPEDLVEAKAMHRSAIEIDSGFAQAYAELGAVFVEMYWDKTVPLERSLDSALFYIDKAVELAPDDPVVHQALGWYYYHGLRDFDKALVEFARVLQLQPNNSMAIASIAWVKRRQGHWEEAREGLRQAIKLDPREPWYRYELGMAHARSGNFAAALPYYDQAIAMQPQNLWAYMLKAYSVFSLTGSVTETQSVLDDAVAYLGPRPEITFFESFGDMVT